MGKMANISGTVSFSLCGSRLLLNTYYVQELVLVKRRKVLEKASGKASDYPKEYISKKNPSKFFFTVEEHQLSTRSLILF